MIWSRPKTMWVSSIGLLAVGALAIASGGLKQPAFGLCCVVAGLGPWFATSAGLERSQLLAYIVFAWSLFGLTPVLMIGEPLGGPYGGSPVIFAAGVLASLGRLFSLSRPQSKAWFAPRV